LLQSSATVDEVFAVVGSAGKKLFATSIGGALYLFKSSRNLLEWSASWGIADNSEKIFAPSACWSLRRGQPHWSESTEGNIRCTHLKDATVANYLCVPLIAQGDTLGVLQLVYGLKQNGAGAAEIHGMHSSERHLGVAAASQIALSLASLRLRESLRDQSIRDPLTGLFNRRFMQECLDRELLRGTRKNRSLAVIFIDVDHFKRFNDVFGHEAGDQVLRSMGDFFRSHFRGDDIICRYGGEEFAIILPESSAQDAASRAELLRIAARTLKLKHNDVTLDPVTLSAGIAGFPEHASSARELLRVADACLYEAKKSGRDRVILAKAKVPLAAC
jgi:diguanylate cyclase (GGDEF)-like protein